MPKLFWIFVTLSLVCCKPKTERQLADTDAKTQTKKEVQPDLNDAGWAVFSTGSCFGYCPEFQMFVTDSHLKILKERNCDSKGAYYTALTEEESKSLKNWGNALDWSNIPEKYITNVADLPSRTFVMLDNENHGTTWHTTPTNDNLKNISKFLLKKYSDAKWKTYPFEGVSENEIANEIIIQLKPGLEVYDWVLSYSDSAANPAQAQDKAGRTWLVRYNPFLVTPKEMKSRLSQDKDLTAYEFVSYTDVR